MRITVVIGAFLSMPPAPAGAIEKVWSRMCACFAADGHEVTVVCPKWGDLPERETIEDVAYHRCSGFDRSGSTWGDLLLDYRYSRVIRRILPPAEVTVFNCFWLPRMVRRRRELGLLDFHLQRFPKRQMWLYKDLDRISTVSDVIADAARAQTPKVGHLLDVVPNPVDIEVFHPDPSYEVPEHLRVVYHGRIHPEKGLDVLIEACRIAHERGVDLRTSIIGPHEIGQGGGGEEYLDHLKSIAEGLSISFEGRIVAPEDLALKLQACDFHCYPSMAFHGEASPVAPLEAMACGAVPVVSDLPQFAGYVRDRETGIVFAREGEGAGSRLADALVELACDDVLRARLRKAAIAQARECAVEVIARRHVTAWSKLMERRG